MSKTLSLQIFLITQAIYQSTKLLSDASQFRRISNTSQLQEKKRNIQTNMPQFIEHTKKFIKNIQPCPGSNPLILLWVSFPTLQILEAKVLFLI